MENRMEQMPGYMPESLRRYVQDNEFRVLVDLLHSFIRKNQYTPSELRMAVHEASVQYENTRVTPKFVTKFDHYFENQMTNPQMRSLVEEEMKNIDNSMAAQETEAIAQADGDSGYNAESYKYVNIQGEDPGDEHQ